MSGITIIERRDLSRLLHGLIHAENRDDVKAEVKYYVQFSFAGTGEDAMAVQTLVDPYGGFNRRMARDLIKQAIAKLDAEEKTSDKGGPISNTAATTADPSSAGAVAPHKAAPAKVAVSTALEGVAE